MTRGKITALYSEAAETYEELWAPELLPLARDLLSHLPLAAAGDILEGGAGVGALLPHLKAGAPAARIVAADLSFGMLQRAPREFPRAVMDASALALKADSFDIGILAFVLFHLFDPQQGITEMARVLRPGGTVGTVTWGEEKDPVACQVWTEEMQIHGAPSEDPDFARFDLVDAPEKVTRLMEASGLRPVESWIGEYRATTTVDEFIAHRTGHGRSRQRLQAMPAPARDRCLESVRARLEALGPEDFEEKAEVVYVVGEKR